MSSKSRLLSSKFTVLLIAGGLTACGGGSVKESQPAAVTSDSAPVEEIIKKSVAAPEPVTQAVVAKPEPVVEPQPAIIATPAPKAIPAPVLRLPTTPNTFLITAAAKSKKHPFFGKGSTIGFNLNGEEGRDVVLTRGVGYVFDIATGIQHDFYLSTSAKGWGAGTFSDGVSGQFIYKGLVSFAPIASTPDLLYYQCRNHKNMGGRILVVDEGEDVAKLKESLAKRAESAVGSTRRRGAAVSEGAVKQKLSYASMVLGSSSAKRVISSGNAEAIGILDSAKLKIANSKDSLATGNLPQAMEQVNEGLRLVTAASRVITTDSDIAGVNQKSQYNELLGSLSTYDGSYKKNLARTKKMGQTPKSTLDEKKYQSFISEAKSLAAGQRYSDANKLLTKAQSMITSVLSDMLHAATVVYDKEFETPEEEYEYELARYESYLELIPVAIEQRHPSERAVELIDGFMKKAAKIVGEGEARATKGDYKMGIMALQAATSNLQRALRIAGVQ